MKKTILTLTLSVILALSALAEPRTITTTKGETYDQATVTSVEPNGITISYDAGIAKIPFAELPSDLRQQFNYDPAKAAAYQAAENHAQAAIAARNAEAVAVAERQRAVEASQTSQQPDTAPKLDKADMVAIQQKHIEESSNAEKVTIGGQKYAIMPNGKMVPVSNLSGIVSTNAAPKKKETGLTLNGL